VTATWTAVPTTVTYTGARAGQPEYPIQLSARLTDTLAGAPLAGQTLTFLLGAQTVTASTGPDGVASVTVTPQAAPGAVPLTVTFAGNGPYTGSSAALLIALQRLPTVLVFTGRTAIANGSAQPVSARLTGARTGQPLSGKTVTFTIGTLTATGTTDANGIASATLTLSATTGPATLKAAYAGDAAHLPASTMARLLIYQPSSFVIWGGNTPGLLPGQRVNFWGSQWERQVTSGDYHARGSFKGYGTANGGPITLCEPTATTTGTPRLDTACWTSKPGNSNPPAALGDFIQVIVTTSVNKSGSTIYGNIASTVVVQVDRTSPYAPDPGHPGYGTIVAVIEDGGGLFPQTATAAPSAPATQDLSASIGRAVAAGTHRYSLYSPELHLIAETELTTGTRPAVTNEYVWLNGHPIAQVDSTGVTNWTFTDHLGTPILQTSSAQGVTWRAEYEPFGEVYALRSYDRHQPLRLPGQEAEQLGTGANGVTERSYNVHRWYRGGWGRYSQADPIGLRSDLNPFRYAGGNPSIYTDSLGLFITRVHNNMTHMAALGTCLESQADQLGDLTAEVDSLPGSQLPENSFMHAMCAPGIPGKTPDDNRDVGYRKVSVYVTQEFNQCSLPGLAKAVHAIEDSFSRGHENCQVWHGWPWKRGGEGWGDFAVHIWSDLDGSLEIVEYVHTVIRSWCEKCKCGR
jgi:RHS repeat-associated protein